MVTDCQVRKLMKLLNEEQTSSLASAKSGMDEKTARKYRCLGKLPSEVSKCRFFTLNPKISGVIQVDRQPRTKKTGGATRSGA